MVTIDATTSPTTTEFTEWIVWADSKIKSYLQCGDTLPTDIGNILKTVGDDLLVRKWHYEKYIKTTNPADVLALKSPIELSIENMRLLDSLKGQDASGEKPGFNFDLDTTTGGFD